MQRRPSASRRSLLSAAAGCFGGSLLLDTWLFDSAAAQSGTTPWQQRWGDGSQRSFSPARPDPESLSRAWSVDVDQPHGDVTVECIGPDRVYVRDYDRLLAYDRRDGALAWTYAAEEGSFARPTLVGDTVVVQENGTVHAVGASSGSTRWTGSFSSPTQSSANPTALDGSVYLPTGSSHLAVNPSTGMRSASVDSASLGTLVAATGSQLVWWSEGTIQATDATGAIQWRRVFGRSFPPGGDELAVTEDAVVVRRLSSLGRPYLTALDRATGETMWEVTDDVTDTATVTAGPDHTYLGSHDRLHAYDTQTGEQSWTLSPTKRRARPVVTPATVFVPFDEGIGAIDPASGAALTAPLLSGRTVRSIGVVDTGVYATAGDSIHALEDA